MAITNTTQLSIFSLLTTVITSDTTLATKFNTSNIVQFEPHYKAVTFKGFPYIHIKIPSTDTEFVTLDHSDTEKEFLADIDMYLEYTARDNFLSYANAFIKAVEGAESTFDGSGYFNAKLELLSIDVVSEEQKDLVLGRFVFGCSGSVAR